jgi:hypothetical protein
MRTTVRLDERLARQVKQYAARQGRTITAVIDDALRQLLARTESAKGLPPYAPTTFKGRLRPGVDLDDSAALLDLMEAPTAARRR